ncbi:MAG: N-acetyltransferase [Anaerolineae bacterium]
MDLDQIRTLYTRQQRIAITYPDSLREESPYVVRQRDDERGSVVYSNLNAENADTVIEAEIAYFRSLGIAHEFEWKWFDRDQPADLKDRLERHGFEADEPEAVLVLDLTHAPARLLAPPTNDIRHVNSDEGVDVMMGILTEVWDDDPEDRRWLGEKLKHNLREAPDDWLLYLAYADGVPASAGWIDFHPGSDFAGLWGGSTLERYRGRGLYTDLVAVRAQEAIRRGVRCLTIDASPMSRAVLEKLGFRLLFMTIPMMYKGA